MSVTREQVMQALFAKLQTSGDFNSVGRRNRNPDTIGAESTPALMMVEHSENYRSPSTHQPAIRRLMVRAIIYFDVGADDNAIPSSLINDILDKIDGIPASPGHYVYDVNDNQVWVPPTPAVPGILSPDNLMTGQCTLGGLAQSAVIDGTIQKAPGDVTGKGLAIVPITIVLP